jgi:hypothetical protein
MTEVGYMVNRIASEISNKKLMNLDIDLSEEMPEILIINDGYDDIHSEKFPYKVNAITLLQSNEDLKNLCLETKGKLIEVDENHKVFANSVEGGRIEIKK